MGNQCSTGRRARNKDLEDANEYEIQEKLEENDSEKSPWGMRNLHLEAREHLKSFCTHIDSEKVAAAANALERFAKHSNGIQLSNCPLLVCQLTRTLCVYFHENAVDSESERFLAAFWLVLSKSPLLVLHGDIKGKLDHVKTLSELETDVVDVSAFFGLSSAKDARDFLDRTTTKFQGQNESEMIPRLESVTSKCNDVISCCSFYWEMQDKSGAHCSLGEALWHYFQALVSANNIILSQMLTRRCESQSRVPFPERHIMVPVRDGNGYPFDTLTASECGKQICLAAANLKSCLVSYDVSSAKKLKEKKDPIQEATVTDQKDLTRSLAALEDENRHLKNELAKANDEMEGSYKQETPVTDQKNRTRSVAALEDENRRLKEELAEANDEIQELMERSIVRGGLFEEVGDVSFRASDLVKRYKQLFDSTGEQMLIAIDPESKKWTDEELDMFRLSLFIVIKEEVDACTERLAGSLRDLFFCQSDVVFPLKELMAKGKGRLQEEQVTQIVKEKLKTEEKFSRVCSERISKEIDKFVSEAVSLLWDVTTSNTEFEFQYEDATFDDSKHETNGGKKVGKIRYFTQPTMVDVSSDRIACRGNVVL